MLSYFGVSVCLEFSQTSSPVFFLGLESSLLSIFFLIDQAQQASQAMAAKVRTAMAATQPEEWGNWKEVNGYQCSMIVAQVVQMPQ